MRIAESLPRFLFVVALTMFAAVILPLQVWAGGPSLVEEIKHDTSPPLRELANSAQVSASAGHQAPVAKPTGPGITSSLPDPVAQVPSGAPVSVTLNLNFDGQSDTDNTTFVGSPVVPPDTNGAVGADQFVQWINLVYAVYDKKTGAKLLGPLPGNNFWLGFGGPCEIHNDGDIIIQYDKVAGRWVAAQPVFSSPFMYCLAVSTTSDATGTYNRYAFSIPNNNFPDYPKLGVWPDAYYVSFNNFSGGSFVGAMACAYDRTNMLAGIAARPAICFQQSKSIGSLLPSDLDGRTPPPSGAPNFFVDIADSTHLNLFKFHVDFTNPVNATFTGPSLISVEPFSELCARATDRSCIPEPSPGEKVDSLGDRLMYRLAYRNFLDHESLVVNHSIEGGALAGVRWYEIRSPNSSPFIFQQGTVIDPSLDYWMGSIAMDHVGNIALGFSVSSDTVDPSVAIVGRSPGDSLGTMEAPLFLVNGSGVQVKSFKRWGDYSSMAVDPKDDCTFWFTQEYYRTTGSFNFSTRISSFKFPSCD